MKIKFLIIAIAIGAVFTSCKKVVFEKTENSTIESPKTVYQGVKFIDSVISFENIESYEKLIDVEDYSKIEKLIEHLHQINSSSYKNNTKRDVLNDELMEVLFNKDLVVKIGDWMIKIFPEKEMLTVISSKETNAYNKLLLGNDDQIKIFSTSDDVIESLKNSSIMTGIFCKESGVGSRSSASYLYKNGIKVLPGNRNIATLEHKKYGVYFKIQVILESTSTTTSYTRKAFFLFTQKNHKQRCRTFYTGTNSLNWTSHGVYNTTSGYVYFASKYVINSGTRNYHKYHVKLRAGFVDVIGGAYVYNGTSNDIEIRVNM